MATQESRIKASHEGDLICVQFLDRNILDESSIQQIGDQIGQLIDEATNPKLLISFEQVEHLSSAALGMLITINNKSKQKGGQLRLTLIDPQIHEVFVITKLDQLFQIHKTAEEAIASFT